MKPPVIIIAAGRSGTKLLRNTLCGHSELVTWPCDEINPIWRYGNANYPTDELRPFHLNERIKRYIVSRFERLAQRHLPCSVVEKTCANSLRAEYVRAVFPDAKFIHMIRDGRDVAASAHRRWRSEDGLAYVLKKARWIPFRDITYYTASFALNHLLRLRNPNSRLDSWGPRFEGMDDLVREKSLIEVCGAQWVECVRAARRGLQGLPENQLLEIRYEQLAQDPLGTFETAFEYLDLEFEEQCRAEVERVVTDSNVAKWKQELNSAQLDRLMPGIRKTLEAEGYLRE